MPASPLKRFVKTLPVVGPLVKAMRPGFRGSARYWEERYRSGGHSGSGSYDRLADFKAEVLNEFVQRHGIDSVIELGCGDGNQLRLAEYPRYLGFDVSAAAVQRCQALFARDSSKSFMTMDDYAGERADLTLSLDVIFHLVEDAVYDRHMRALFNSAQRFVGIYSSNDAGLNKILGGGREHRETHEHHRTFTDWIAQNAPGWRMVRHVPNRYPFDPNSPSNTSLAEFFFYARQ